MAENEERREPGVQASDNSVAVGSFRVDGPVEGSVIIGSHNIVGFTSEQVTALVTKISTTFEPKQFDGRSPYKGLDVFEEEDAEMFFGREKLVEDLVSRIKESRTVFVTGPSGSGKSSLVRAGLIHTLKQGKIQDFQSERWLYASLKPGRDPIEAIANAFSRLKSPELGNYFREHAHSANALNECAESALTERKDQRLVLFIDQFEEVFTQLSKDKAGIFIQLLDRAATVENGRVVLLFAMRSDFISNCATFPQLNALLNQQFVQIGAMQPEELVSAIAQPALRVGLRIDPELIAQIINDMKGEPGALPLMQFALKDLFDSQQAKGKLIDLNLKDYLARGGIRKALERHADTSFTQLDGHEQELARSIFTKLIEIGRGTQDTRRTAIFDELIPANASEAEIQAIVQKLSDARLITTDEIAGRDTVTISHEKLIEAWPWLKKLVNENRDVIALQNEIAEDAKEWEEHKRDASYLYSGARLSLAQEQVRDQKLLLSGPAKEFIQEGINVREAERKARETLRRRISAGLIAGIVVALVLAGFAVYQMFQARQQAAIALARQLAAQAPALSASKAQTAVLLGVESMRLLPSVEASQILQTNSLPRVIANVTHNGPVHSVAFSPNGRYVVSGGCDQYKNNACTGGSARLWEATTGKEVTRLSFNGEVFSSAFDPDGKYVVSEGCDKYDKNNICIQGSARVWEAATGREISSMEYPGWVRVVTFSPDGKYVLSGGEDGTARVWEAATGKEIARRTHPDIVAAAAFSPDGKYVASSSVGDETTSVWETLTGREVLKLESGGAISVAFSPDGKSIVTGSGWILSRDPGGGGAGGGYDAIVWDATTGKLISGVTYDLFVYSVAFSPDGKYVLSGSADGTARLWKAATGEEILRVTHDGPVTFAAFSADGKYVVSGGDRTARVWEAATGREVLRMTHDGSVTSAAFSPDGNYVVSGSVDDTARVWSTSANQLTTHVINVDNYGPSVELNPDKQHFIVWDACEQYDSASNCVSALVRLWAVDSGKETRIKYDTGLNWITFSSDGRYFVAGVCDHSDNDGRCDASVAYVTSTDTGREVARIVYPGQVNFLALSPDGKYLLSEECEKLNENYLCSQGSVHVWTVETGDEIAQKTHDHEAQFAAFSPDGNYILSGACDDDQCSSTSADVWESTTGKEVARITYPGDISIASFSPDGNYIVLLGCETSACSPHSARVWAVETGKEVASLPSEYIESEIPFSTDGKYLALPACDKRDAYFICTQSSIGVWEIATGKERARMPYLGEIYALSFSLDGKYLLFGGCNKEINRACAKGSAHVQAIDTGQEVSKMTYDDVVMLASFSPDGKYVISKSTENTARVWEAATGKEVARITYPGVINLLSFSSDGNSIISAGCDQQTGNEACPRGSIRVWKYHPADLIAEACSRLTRNLTRDEWKQYIGGVLPYQAVCENLPIESEEMTTTP